MDAKMKIFIALAAFLGVCAAQPISKQEPPLVLKASPFEVLFKADNYSTVLLECAFEEGGKDAKYTWYKNGQPFDWEAAGHIGQRPGEGSIMFFNPQPQDAADYQCHAETPQGIASTPVIRLTQTFFDIPKKEAAKEHTPIEGRTYKLDCPIPNAYPAPTIVWKTQLRSDPSIMNDVRDHRYTTSPDGTLYFSNVTESDVSPSYKYVCFGRNEAVNEDVVLAEHFLTAVVKDTKPNDGEMVPQYLSKDVVVAEVGNVTMIYCIYGGSPLAHPDWFKDGKDVNGEPNGRVTRYNHSAGKRLLIKETRLEDEGTYTCTVDNEVGKKQSHSIKLSVVSAPKLTQKHEKAITVKEGEDISVPCQVTGLPEPKTTWTYNTKPNGNSRASYKDGVLFIKGAQKTDTGYYGCNAQNEYGILYSETLVSVV